MAWLLLLQGAFLQHNSPGVIEECISQQLNLMARLRHIVDIVKVGRRWEQGIGKGWVRVGCKGWKVEGAEGFLYVRSASN